MSIISPICGTKRSFGNYKKKKKISDTNKNYKTLKELSQKMDEVQSRIDYPKYHFSEGSRASGVKKAKKQMQRLKRTVKKKVTKMTTN